MPRRSVATVVAGGLISGVTVMGVDAALHQAEAATMDQSFGFSLTRLGPDPWLDGITYIDPGAPGSGGGFVFDGFDPVLGRLNTATLGVSITGLLNAPALTCCFDLNDVQRTDGTIAGTPLSDLVGDLGDGSVRLFLDPATIGRQANTVGFELGIFFNDRAVYPDTLIPLGGTITLSYDYTPAAVPLPSSAALLGSTSLCALLAAGVATRRRRKAA